MTENKRFILTEQFVTLQGITFVKDDNAYKDTDTYYTVGEAVDLLNELHDEFQRVNEENKLLKSDNNRLVNETAKIVAEHQKNVLDLINGKINEYIYKEKLYKHIGKDREASVFNLYCLCLNNLKKELQE